MLEAVAARLARLARIARPGPWWLFGGRVEWKQDGDMWVSAGGRRLSADAYRRHMARLGREANAPAQKAQAPAAPAAPPAPAQAQTEYDPAALAGAVKAAVAGAKPANVDPKVWDKLSRSRDVLAAARYVARAAQEAGYLGADVDAENLRDWNRALKWRLQDAKLPVELAPAAVELAKAIDGAAGKAGVRAGGVALRPPARGARYNGADEWNGARYGLLNESPELRDAKRAIDDLSHALHDRAAEQGRHFGRWWLSENSPLKHAEQLYTSETAPAPRWTGDNRPAVDPLARTPLALRAAWDKYMTPALEQTRALLAFANDPKTYDPNRDPQELVEAGRALGTGMEFARHVIESLHGFRFNTGRPLNVADKEPTWYDVTAGRATVADVRVAQADKERAWAAQQDRYALDNYRKYKAAVAVLDTGKDTRDVGALNRKLRKAKVGRVEVRADRQVAKADGSGMERGTEFYFWPEGGGTAITARSVDALLAKLRTIVVSLPEAAVTAERLDKLRYGR